MSWRLILQTCANCLLLLLLYAKSVVSVWTSNRWKPINPGRTLGVLPFHRMREVKSEVKSQSMSTISDPMDCGFTQFSVHGFHRPWEYHYALIAKTWNNSPFNRYMKQTNCSASDKWRWYSRLKEIKLLTIKAAYLTCVLSVRHTATWPTRFSCPWFPGQILEWSCRFN